MALRWEDSATPSSALPMIASPVPDLAPAPAFLSVTSMPLREAQSTTWGRDTVVLSLVTPGDTPPVIHASGPHWVTFLPDPSMAGVTDRAVVDRACRELVGWIAAQAFRDRHLVIHCLMGISRSPAVANAIADSFAMTATHRSAAIRPDPTVRETVTVVAQECRSLWHRQAADRRRLDARRGAR